MIICLVGGIGSGKTLSVVKEIVTSNNYPITNFRLKNVNYHRLKYSDLITEVTDDKKKTLKVNWLFWENLRKKHKFFSIYLDEAHNLIGSRASMSKRNQLLSNWISQIRKILSDNPFNHIYIITQNPRRIDINFRELTQVVIECRKAIINKKVIIFQRYYNGFDDYYMRFKAEEKTWFFGNKYFKYYDTTDMVRFSDVEDFV